MLEKKKWKKKLDWYSIGLLAIILFGILAQASQASPVGTFIQEKRIDIISQTGILDTNLTYTFKELNNTHWIANFCVKPTTSAVFNPVSYPLTSLTGGISFEQNSPIRFNTASKCGWFYIIFPKGFQPNLMAQFGENSTIISTTITVPFYPNQRAICRDGLNYIHVVWLYNSTVVAYANSTDNGATFTNSLTAVNTSGTKNTPSISCDGNNITVAYVNGSASLAVFISTNNGASFSDVSPSSATTGKTVYEVDVERRGQRIYLIYGNATTASARPSILFLNSTDAGVTWGTRIIIEYGFYLKLTGTPAIYDEYLHPSLAVNGTGGTDDILHVLYQEDGSDVDIISFGIYYQKSSNSGVSWGSFAALLSDSTNAMRYPSITFSGINLFGSFYRALNTVWFANSTDNGASWTTAYQISIGTNASNYSTSTVNVTNPFILWVNGTSTNTNIFYRNYNGASWDSVVNYTTDNAGNNYPNAKYDYSGNCIEFVYRNATASPYSIIYSALETCTAPSSGGAVTPPVMDIGDPLYCSIPPFIPSVQSVAITCMPKSNTTGQPVTGATVTCKVWTSPYFAAQAQAEQTCTEAGNGLYNCTFLAANQAANTCYIINCSTTINTVVNWFAGTTCVMRNDLATSADIANILGNMSGNFTATNDLINNLDLTCDYTINITANNTYGTNETYNYTMPFNLTKEQADMIAHSDWQLQYEMELRGYESTFASEQRKALYISAAILILVVGISGYLVYYVVKRRRR